MGCCGVAVRADPETYLRLAGERILLTQGRGNNMPEGSAMAIIGRALIAAGALDAEWTRSVLEEYSLAMALRLHGGRMRMRHLAPGRAQGSRLSAQRVVVCALSFDEAGEHRTLHRVLFAEDTTHLDLSGIGAPGQASISMGPVHHMRMMRGMGPGIRQGAQTLAVADDHGTAATAQPHGSSSSDRSWQATFVTNMPLHPDTCWIEIDGHRFELPPRTPVPEAHVEAVEQIHPLRAMFYKEILGTDHRHGGADLVEVAMEALIATGVLTEDDSLVTDVRRIAGAVTGGVPVPDLPEPWASLVRRFSKSDGPTGRIPIGAAIDSVDGYSVRFDALASEPTSFTLSLAVSPGDPLLRQFPGFLLERSALDWWAEDDRMNSYVAFNASGGGSGELAQGEVHSLAPLDPKATVLRLLPTGPNERGVITIPLAGLGDPP